MPQAGAARVAKKCGEIKHAMAPAMAPGTVPSSLASCKSCNQTERATGHVATWQHGNMSSAQLRGPQTVTAAAAERHLSRWRSPSARPFLRATQKARKGPKRPERVF